MIMTNKAVIFDFDGTVADTVQDLCDSLNVAMRRFGYKEVEVGQVITYVGNGAKNLVSRCIGEPVGEDRLNEVLNFYNRTYIESGSKKTRPFDGVTAMLKTLKNRGYKLAILTNKPQENTDDIVGRIFEKDLFDKVVGQSKNVKCKPDKTATLNILKDFGVLPENAYFVGDGETDVITSINAGTNGIAVLWGYRTKDQLAKVGATTFAYSVEDLLNIIP